MDHPCVLLNISSLPTCYLQSIPSSARLCDQISPVAVDSIILLGGNTLTTVRPNALSGLPSLIKLDLKNNKLVTLPESLFSNNTKLETLHLENNKLVSLSGRLFSNNINLQILDLLNNMLVSLPKDLFLSNTNLKELDLEKNKYIGSNNLVNLPKDLLFSNTNLETLYLGSNKLVSLPVGLFSNNRKLLVLGLENNMLVSLPEGLFTFNTDLRFVYLESNNLKSLPKDLYLNTNLITLNMNKNQFICCLMIDFKDWASNQTQLTYEGTCTVLNTTIDIHSFNTTTCIIPGWSPWINSSCSTTCGDGVIISTRICDNPPPSDNGLKCVGSETETSLCNLQKCPASCRRSKKRIRRQTSRPLGQ
ncbi:unnamed protein product [Mytilus coruscus]|uniref:LRRNT domain-containing protein n=1 Tax=Mytilus coruscus TaxID=42192 RepID=A0A6J8EVB1_MYTCO|nr:unnamed protein product [Mytilus coruscus]